MSTDTKAEAPKYAGEDKAEPQGKPKDKSKGGARVDHKDPYEGLPRRRFFTDAGAGEASSTKR